MPKAFTPSNWITLFTEHPSDTKIFPHANHQNPFPGFSPSLFYYSQEFLYVFKPFTKKEMADVEGILQHFSELNYNCTLFLPCIVNNKFNLVIGKIKNRKKSLLLVNSYKNTPKLVKALLNKQLFADTSLLELNRKINSLDKTGGIQAFLIAQKFLTYSCSHSDNSELNNFLSEYTKRDIDNVKFIAEGNDFVFLKKFQHSTFRNHKKAIIGGVVIGACFLGIATLFLWPIIVPALVSTFAIIAAVSAAVIVGGLIGLLFSSVSYKIYDNSLASRRSQIPIVLEKEEPGQKDHLNFRNSVKKINEATITKSLTKVIKLINQENGNLEILEDDVPLSELRERVTNLLNHLLPDAFLRVFKLALQNRDDVLCKDFLGKLVYQTKSVHLYRFFEEPKPTIQPEPTKQTGSENNSNKQEDVQNDIIFAC